MASIFPIRCFAVQQYDLIYRVEWLLTTLPSCCRHAEGRFGNFDTRSARFISALRVFVTAYDFKINVSLKVGVFALPPRIFHVAFRLLRALLLRDDLPFGQRAQG